MNDDLCGPVLRLCDRVASRHTEGRLLDTARRVAERLADGRLRIAVGGRMNAGKSTLVNALIGRRIAPTDNTECTLVVTRYHPSHLDRVTVRSRSGAAREVRMGPRGGLPVEPGGLGWEPEDIEWVDVEFSGSTPAGCLLVDTPGLDSPNHGDEASLAALRDADATFFVMPHPGGEDAKAFAEIRRGTGTSWAAATGRIGVISQIDWMPEDSGDDPWPDARRVAATYTAKLRDEVTEVIPVAGLLAETALGGDFTEDDAEALGRLARHDLDELDEALYDADNFLGWDKGPLAEAARARLFRMLGVYGLRLCAEFCAAGPRSPAEILDHLRERSGVDRLIERIEVALAPRTDWLRAVSALARLTEAALADPRGGWLLDTVEELGRRPAFVRAELREALREMEAGRPRLPAEDIEALRRLATRPHPAEALGLPPGATRDELARAAGREVSRWRRVEQDPALPPRLRRTARTAMELCHGHHPDVRR
ncbi:dynamin family protein [Sphaerisporangium aureirubrum]|uniref:Dynamin family protein n=1 Tax=Sphaerisporangium aureirubrum TaxID=1544736 RepID=A0ABW1NP68_9ACTN